MLQRLLLSLLGALLLLASILLWNRHGLGTPCVGNMDRAYTHLSVAMAARGEAYEGAFSHAGFRHPGPALFYYLAGTSAVLTHWMSQEDSFRLAVTLLNCASIGLAVFLLSGLTPHRAYSLLLVPISFVIISPRALFDYWNPHPIPAAVIAYLLALVYLAYGRLRYLPFIVALGSLIAQCHISTPPFLAVTLAYALGACVWRRRMPAGQWALPVVVSVALGAVLWLGPLIDFFRYGLDSNILTIARSFLEEHRTSPLSRSFIAVWNIASKKLNLFFGLPPDFAKLLPLAFLAAVIGTTPRRGAFFHVRALILLSWAMTIWALTQSFQPMADYLITYFLGVLTLAATVTVMAITDRAAGLISRMAPIGEEQGRRMLSALALVAVVFSAARHPGLSMVPKRDSCAPSRFADRFVQSLGPDSTALYELSPTTLELRGFSVFFALQMLGRGAQICFDDQWEHYMGRALTCSYRKPRDHFAAAVPVEISLLGKAPPKGHKGGHILKERRTMQIDWVDSDGAPHSFSASTRQ